MIVPAVTALLVLGRAFDINTMKDRNVYIFDAESIKGSMQTINRTFTQAQYRFIESSSDSNDFLDIDGDLSIKVKKGQIDIQGYGSYLMKTTDREDTLEMLITVYHETGTETFPSYAKVRSDWMSKHTKDVGTHYIRSITYGGQLIISYKMKARKKEDMQEIKAAVTANLAISGSIDAKVSGNLDKLSKEIGDKISYEIRAFATAGSVSHPQSMEEVFKMVDGYPSEVKKLNGGKGLPLKVEIISLHTLSTNHSDYLKNFAMDALLKEATNKYDDVRLSTVNLRNWDKKGGIWTKDQQKLINEYNKRLSKANAAFLTAITNLKADGGLNQFDEAFKAYGADGENLPNRYARELTKLQHTVMKKDFHWHPYTQAVSHFIHWGGTNCSLPKSEPVFIGLAGTAPVGRGNGGTVQCLRAPNPKLVNQKLTNGTTVSAINGLTFHLPDKSEGPVLCSFCQVKNSTATITIAGRTDCPPKMRLEYSGYLMTGKHSGTASTFICLNKKPQTSIPKVKIGADKTAASLKPVWIYCPKCEEKKKKKFISCVVCSG